MNVYFLKFYIISLIYNFGSFSNSKYKTHNILAFKHFKKTALDTSIFLETHINLKKEKKSKNYNKK